MTTGFLKSLTPTEQLVVALVGQRSQTQVSAADVAAGDWSQAGPLFQIAAANEVVGHVAHALAERGVDLPAAWQSVHQQTATRITRYLEELDTVADAFHSAGIPLVALKNAGIARALHPCAGCCPMGDLDVLVRRRDFRAAHRLLVERGFEFEFRSPLERPDLDEAELDGGAEYWKQLDDGSKLWFELQWRPIAGRWLRPDQEPTAAELIRRSVGVPGSHVRILSPTDNLLQVAVHTAKHSYVRAPGFRLHTDVDRIVHTQHVDWDALVANVIRRELTTAVYFALKVPAELFQTPIPASVFEELRPAAWKEAILADQLRRAGLLYPDRAKFGRLRFIGFTALLYDSWAGFWRGVFPQPAWMAGRYRTRGLGLWAAYLQRIWGLAFRRNKT